MNRYEELDNRFYSVKDLARFYPAFGVAAGFYRNITAKHKFGHNGAVGATYETLWNEGGIYVYVSVPTTMTISSSSTEDDVGGDGAITVYVEGLGDNWEVISEIATMNGQAGVTLQHKYLRVNRMKVLTTGVTLGNEGIVYVGTGAIGTGKPAVVHAKIEIDENQSLMGLWSIPNGHQAYLMDYQFEASIIKEVTAKVAVREFGSVFQLKDYAEFRENMVGSGLHLAIDSYPARTDIELRARAVGGGGDVAGQMVFWLEKLTE